MTNKYIDDIITAEIERLQISRNPFFKEGYMGLCLFLFWYYEHTKNRQYYDLAQNILRKACGSIKKGSLVNFWNGMSGIGDILNLLSEKKYVTGNIYKILKNLDDEIYKSVINAVDYRPNFSLNNHEEALIDVACYTAKKINKGILPDGELRIQELFLNKIINVIYQYHNYSLFCEPMSFSMDYLLPRFISSLSYAHEIKSCRERIENIWGESRRNILTQFPYLGSNRILLLISVNRLRKTFPDDLELRQFAERLDNNISFSQISQLEFPTECLSMHSGLSGLIILTKLFFEKKITNAESLLCRYQKSCYYEADYNEITKKGFVGLNGILGFIISFISLQNGSKKD